MSAIMWDHESEAEKSEREAVEATGFSDEIEAEDIHWYLEATYTDPAEWEDDWRDIFAAQSPRYMFARY